MYVCVCIQERYLNHQQFKIRLAEELLSGRTTSNETPRHAMTTPCHPGPERGSSPLRSLSTQMENSHNMTAMSVVTERKKREKQQLIAVTDVMFPSVLHTVLNFTHTNVDPSIYL